MEKKEFFERQVLMSVLYVKGCYTHQSLSVRKEELEQMSFNSGAKCPYGYLGPGSGGVVLPDLRRGLKVNPGNLKNPSISALDTANLRPANPQYHSEPIWMFTLPRLLHP